MTLNPERSTPTSARSPKSKWSSNTGLWDGERSPTGVRRPDATIERIASVSVAQTWNVLESEGYVNHYEGHWICTHPGLTLCGRAVTTNFMPRRQMLAEIERGYLLELNESSTE